MNTHDTSFVHFFVQEVLFYNPVRKILGSAKSGATRNRRKSDTYSLMEKLKELRKKIGISLRVAESHYGIGYTTIALFEKSENEKLRRFLKYFLELSEDAGVSRTKALKHLANFALEEPLNGAASSPSTDKHQKR